MKPQHITYSDSVRSIPCYPELSHVILDYLILQMRYLDLLTLVQSTSHNLRGSVRLDLDLLKPWRVSAAAAVRDEHASPPVKHMSQQQPSQVWLEYAYSKHHPALQWLPTKLAERIAMNMQVIARRAGLPRQG